MVGVGGAELSSMVESSAESKGWSDDDEDCVDDDDGVASPSTIHPHSGAILSDEEAVHVSEFWEVTLEL